MSSPASLIRIQHAALLKSPTSVAGCLVNNFVPLSQVMMLWGPEFPPKKAVTVGLI
jgi:hypothetical protein